MQNKVIRGAALADLAVTLPFALPVVAEAVIGLIRYLDVNLGFGTADAFFDTSSPLSMMFIHIMGVLGVVWALGRLRHPLYELSRIDAYARLIVAGLILYAISQGATPVLWVFILTEVAGSAAQLIWARR